MMRLALLEDYPEEQWPSMDLCAQMLFSHLQTEFSHDLQVDRLCPSFRWRWSRLPGLGNRRLAYNGDRLLNRFWDYPQHLPHCIPQFDAFHLCDHSYAHLVKGLPTQRTGVFCHDLDTFRCLLEPGQEPRPRWFRLMARRILTGLQQAAVVFYSTGAVRQQIEAYRLVSPDRLVYSPYGIAPEFCPAAEPTASLPLPAGPFLLHVGSTISRKRMDVLLEVFAGVRAVRPDLHLVKVGGAWTEGQRQQIDRLGIGSAILHLQNLDRGPIAALYRRAALVLLPSEAEGFGLPLVEALACGAIVLASNIPVLREVGGPAVVYCPVGEVSAWIGSVLHLLHDPQQAPPASLRLAQANRYSWAHHARTIATTYQQLVS